MNKYTQEQSQTALKELKDQWKLDSGGDSISMLTSHDIAGLSERDFKLARHIEML